MEVSPLSGARVFAGRSLAAARAPHSSPALAEAVSHRPLASMPKAGLNLQFQILEGSFFVPAGLEARERPADLCERHGFDTGAGGANAVHRRLLRRHMGVCQSAIFARPRNSPQKFLSLADPRGRCLT